MCKDPTDKNARMQICGNLCATRKRTGYIHGYAVIQRWTEALVFAIFQIRNSGRWWYCCWLCTDGAGCFSQHHRELETGHSANHLDSCHTRIAEKVTKPQRQQFQDFSLDANITQGRGSLESPAVCYCVNHFSQGQGRELSRLEHKRLHAGIRSPRFASYYSCLLPHALLGRIPE